MDTLTDTLEAILSGRSDIPGSRSVNPGTRMQGYFLVADVLGFSTIVRNLDVDTRKERVGRWLHVVREGLDRSRLRRHQLISDTVFADADDSAGGLKSLIVFSRELLQQGIRYSLPIRGAIVYGEYEWGDLLHGQAVVDAHQLERNQNWIGVACALGLPHRDECWGEDQLIAYPVPLKDGILQVRPAVGWSVPHTVPLFHRLGGGGLAKEGESISWHVGEKATNTVHFGVYRELRRRKGGPWNTFPGKGAIDIIERAALGEPIDT